MLIILLGLLVLGFIIGIYLMKIPGDDVVGLAGFINFADHVSNCSNIRGRCNKLLF